MLITIDAADELIFKTKKYKKLTNLRVLPFLSSFPAMIFVYGNKVALFTLEKDLVGIIIENEQVAKAIKIIFNLYWSQAKVVES